MNISYLALIEIFRDFVQLVSITVVSLGVHIDLPMKYSFASISDWISLNFVLTVNVSVKSIMGAQLIILLMCTIYLIYLTVREIKKKFQGQEAQAEVEHSKFQRYISRAVIFIICTVFAPLCQSSLKVFAGTIEHVDDSDTSFMQFMSVISLILLIIVNPILFYYGIKNTLPKENKFDTSGGEQVDYRELYSVQLKKHHNPFKELYKDYSYKGSYYKLLMMLFKFIRMCLMVKLPNPYDNVGSFWGIYMADIVVNHIFLYLNFKILPFHDFQSNRSALLGIGNQIVVIILNIILLLVDNKRASNTDAQRAISILQLLSSVVIFLAYFLKTFLGGSSMIRNLFKTIFRKLSFTSIKRRGIYNVVGFKDPYLEYIYFNNTHYKKEQEMRIIIWEGFWKNLISTDKSLKSDIPIEELAFVNPGNAPPYLRNFRGSAEERLEENTRIMQSIGRSYYEEELKNYKSADYIQLILDVFNYVPPVDAYLLESKQGQQKAYGFCKVSFFPFPFTCQLAFDGQSEMKEIKGREELKEFVSFMKTPQYQEMRLFRTKLRALNKKSVYHKIKVATTVTKARRNSEGKEESYTINATITYENGVFYVESEIEAIAQLNNRQSLDVGKGLICSLYYANGDGLDDEGCTFTGSSYTISHSDLQINYFNSNQGKISTIISENLSQWEPFITSTLDLYAEYLRNIIININKKAECLSYDFNLKILAAPYDVFIDKTAIQEMLEEEKNPILKQLFKTQSERFEALYKKLTLFDQSDYRAYLYLFFQDLWDMNKDLRIIKKNQDLFDPQSTHCLIYKHDLTIQDWKKIFVHKGLRTKAGGGYFDNKLMKKFQRMINQQPNSPDNFLNQSDLVSLSSKKQTAAIQQDPSKQHENTGALQADVHLHDIEQPLKNNNDEQLQTKLSNKTIVDNQQNIEENKAEEKYQVDQRTMSETENTNKNCKNSNDQILNINPS